MDIAIVGLGKMGLNMATRLLQGSHRVVAFDVNRKSLQGAEGVGAEGVETIDDITSALAAPRAVWVMVPAGDATEDTLRVLADILSEGDIIIDGGNSNYKDSERRAEFLKGMGIHFVDVGTSGGIWGLKEGYSLMVGGEEEIVEHLRPVFETLAPAPDRGWGHVGPSGAGHFVKMVHNGIEYGLMQAYAEGFDIMNAKKEFDLDLYKISEIWRYGSVVRSWLLDLTAEALAEDPQLTSLKAWVEDSGEGRWTVAEAIDKDVPAPIITLALEMRLVSRQQDSYAAKILSAMRNKFGGHKVRMSHE